MLLQALGGGILRRLLAQKVSLTVTSLFTVPRKRRLELALHRPA